jgi:hypothetical protein
MQRSRERPFPEDDERQALSALLASDAFLCLPRRDQQDALTGMERANNLRYGVPAFLSVLKNEHLQEWSDAQRRSAFLSVEVGGAMASVPNLRLSFREASSVAALSVNKEEALRLSPSTFLAVPGFSGLPADVRRRFSLLMTDGTLMGAWARISVACVLEDPSFWAQPSALRNSQMAAMVLNPNGPREHPDAAEHPRRAWSLVPVAPPAGSTRAHYVVSIDKSKSARDDDNWKIGIDVETRPKDPWLKANSAENIAEILARTPSEGLDQIKRVHSLAGLNGRASMSARASGDVDVYGIDLPVDAVHVGIMMHEAGHIASLSRDDGGLLLERWQEAMGKDQIAPSSYPASKQPASQVVIEDLAEFWLFYFEKRGQPEETLMRSVYPARYHAFEAWWRPRCRLSIPFFGCVIPSF